MASPTQSNPEPSLDEALQEILRLRRENDELSNDLENCKDQLFEFMKKENDIPEHAVKETFASIFYGIESWIDEISSEENFDSNFKAHTQHLQSSRRREHFADLGLDSRYFDIEWTAKLKQLDTCYYMILSLVIAKCLFQDIIRLGRNDEWGAQLPFGLPPDLIRLLELLQQTMSDTLKRDQTQIARWRAETVAALVVTEEFEDAADSQSKDVLRQLRRRLQFWIGKDVSDQQCDSLRRNVIDRATEAVRMMARSKKSYIMVTESFPPGPIPDEASSWPVKDIESWSTLSSKDVSGAFFCMYPGLTRKGTAGQKDLLLVKPTLLGFRNPDLQPKLSSSRTPTPRTPSPRKPEQKQDQRRQLVREGSWPDTRTAARSPRTRSPPGPRSPAARPPDTKPEQQSKGLAASLGSFFRLGPSRSSPGSPQNRSDARDLRDSREPPSGGGGLRRSSRTAAQVPALSSLFQPAASDSPASRDPHGHYSSSVNVPGRAHIAPVADGYRGGNYNQEYYNPGFGSVPSHTGIYANPGTYEYANVTIAQTRRGDEGYPPEPGSRLPRSYT